MKRAPTLRALALLALALLVLAIDAAFRGLGWDADASAVAGMIRSSRAVVTGPIVVVVHLLAVVPAPAVALAAASELFMIYRDSASRKQRRSV
jgi:hypothetical protein